ncbi:MAG: SRPBCC family protein [Kineosporiaceae bacterium]|nr:SRPBCC family protein [Aeromicrobium sp.]
MSTLRTAAATMQQLSQAGMEEASRHGLRVGDLEHLFAALVINDQRAGRALRATGLSLEAVRDATHKMNAANLQRLGVTTTPAEPQRIVFQETRGYEWTPRAMDVLTSAGGKNAGDAEAVLRALLTEPSGLMADLLARLEMSVEAVQFALAPETAQPAQVSTVTGMSPAKRGLLSEVFVPATVTAVWSLLADPTRLPEWHHLIGSVEVDTAAEIVPGVTWTVLAPTHRPDGTPVRIKERFRRHQMQLLVLEEPHRISWRSSRPDLPRRRAIELSIEITAAAGGCQVRATSSGIPSPRWRPLSLSPVHPLQRFLHWISLTQITAGISRAFR